MDVCQMVERPAHTFWGKLNPDTGAQHPLADHCVDVAAVFRALLDLRVASALQSLEPVQKDRLAVVAFLHDLGKCNVGFQRKSHATSHPTAGHVLEAVAWIRCAHEHWPESWSELVTLLCTWFDQESSAFSILIAAFSHHGRPVSELDFRASGECDLLHWWRAVPECDPASGVAELAITVRQMFPGAFANDAPALRSDAQVQHRFAGLLMLADWIGSDTRYFPYRATPSEDRQALAHRAARRALRDIGLLPPDVRRVAALTTVFPFVRAATPLQQLLAEGLGDPPLPNAVLIESDTGSGKTEAALTWFFRLFALGQVDGLYFALPTRVAARELYGRVVQAMQHAFEPDHRLSPVLLAVPGYVRADGEALLTDPGNTLWDDNCNDRVRERVWAAERPKRFLAAPVAVGTIDQALLSVLRTKHSLLRSVCLDRHLLVVDEVHASDRYMRELLKTLLQRHLRRGGSAMLLSATLGDAATAELFGRAPLGFETAIARPYPSITTPQGEIAVAASGRRKMVSVETHPSLDDDAPLVGALCDALGRGARVLVICNTVKGANRLLRAVEAHPDFDPSWLFALDGVRCPHHGRFARADRERLDAAVTARFGKSSAPGPVLLIGTQTLEQSLDLDADWLVSDLCPMDVLLQRIGRLHRHVRERPLGFEIASATVRTPDKSDLRDYLHRGRLRGPSGLGAVYADGRILQRTWDLLREQPLWTIPDDNRRLVESAVHPELITAMNENWNEHRDLLDGQEIAELRAALHATLDEQPFWELHDIDKSERIAARLGEPAWEIPLASVVRSPFGVVLDRLTIPAHLAPDSLPPISLEVSVVADGLTFVWGSAFRYTRFGLEKISDA